MWAEKDSNDKSSTLYYLCFICRTTSGGSASPPPPIQRPQLTGRAVIAAPQLTRPTPVNHIAVPRDIRGRLDSVVGV